MYYIVVDLEMCRVPKNNRKNGFKWANETIQIGAVKLNDNYEIVDEFMTFVSPQYGILDKRIEKLTGITQSDLKEAPNMEKALEQFVAWLPNEITMVAWSENDERQIKNEVLGKNIVFDGVERLEEKWLDCQISFSKVINNERRYKLQDALNVSDILYDSRIHDGLVDAKNTALLFKKMQTEEKFSFNSYFYNMDNEPDVLTSSLGSLLAGCVGIQVA